MSAAVLVEEEQGARLGRRPAVRVRVDVLSRQPAEAGHAEARLGEEDRPRRDLPLPAEGRFAADPARRRRYPSIPPRCRPVLMPEKVAGLDEIEAEAAADVEAVAGIEADDDLDRDRP